MSRMFYAYDNNIDLNDIALNACDLVHELDDFSSTTKMLYTKTGKQVGIQIKYKKPFSLYFNLCEAPDGQEFIEFVANSHIIFKIKTTTHKTVLEKLFNGYEIFNPSTNDLCITLLSKDLEFLKQESYRVELQLLYEGEYYSLFNEQDVYLVFR